MIGIRVVHHQQIKSDDETDHAIVTAPIPVFMHMAFKPEVTAVITCMTAAELPFILETVQSVKRQTLPCEIVLYTSHDLDVEGALGEAAAGIELRRVPLQPPGIIRNLAVAEAKTDWIAFLDGDDLWKPTKLERQLAFARQTQSEALGCRHLLIREDGKAFFFAFAKTMPMPSSWIVRRELLVKEPFTSRLVFEDWELWTRLRQCARTATLNDYLTLYRVRKLSASTHQSSPKRRKYLFARVSAVPGLRFVLLAASYLWGSFVAHR